MFVCIYIYYIYCPYSSTSPPPHTTQQHRSEQTRSKEDEFRSLDQARAPSLSFFHSFLLFLSRTHIHPRFQKAREKEDELPMPDESVARIH